MKTVERLFWFCLGVLIYFVIGTLFHAMLKGDELSWTASTIGLIVGWPFIFVGGVFTFCGVILLFVIVGIIVDHVLEKHHKRQLRKGKAQPTLNDVIDEILIDSAKEQLKKERPKYRQSMLD